MKILKSELIKQLQEEINQNGDNEIEVEINLQQNKNGIILDDNTKKYINRRLDDTFKILIKRSKNVKKDLNDTLIDPTSKRYKESIIYFVNCIKETCELNDDYNKLIEQMVVEFFRSKM